MCFGCGSQHTCANHASGIVRSPPDSFQVATTHGGEALKAALARAHATIAEEDNAAGTEANGDGGEEEEEEGEEEDAAMTAAAAAMSGQELVRTLPVRCGVRCVW